MTPEIVEAREYYERKDNYHQQLRTELARTSWWRFLYRRRLKRAKEGAWKAAWTAQERLLRLLAVEFKKKGQADGR